ncbi:MAG: chitobiase/beta-hexosaminidase C-terminal domain-containing protein, partial [Erysipelotrichaceae bacterium]|nr:chitobiase/beta-hexosaminidase C-terminal domain-containing protein [Erysipelotrichaceae bacterium]
MHVQAICAWANDDLPVMITIQGEVKTEQEEDGDEVVVVVRPRVKITTNEAKKKEIYLVATLKGRDAASNTEKALYMDRRVFSIPKGAEGLTLNATSGSHDFDLTLDSKYTNAVATLELVALEKKPNGTTGSTYSNVAVANVIRDVGLTDPSAWSTEKPQAQDGRVITPKTQYRYRDKVTAYSGQETLAGYTKEGSESLGTSYTRWDKGTGTNTVRRYDQYKEVVTAENVKAYKSACKICSCGKWAEETKSGKCSYCGTNTITNRKLKVFSSQKLSGTKQSGSGNGGGAYRYGKTITEGQSYSGIGYVYMITYGHDNIQRLSTFTSKNAKGYLFLWQDDNGATQDFYRLKTEKIRNKFYKYNNWSEWSDSAVNASATRQVEQRTVYSYQDKIQPPALETDLTENASEVKTFSGNLDVDEDLDGKKGTVMVYQANNTDPNKYQMQYTGQITFETDLDNEEIGKNHYAFSFIPKDNPSVSTGNFIVSIGVEGTTGLVRVGVVESPKEDHTVTLFYQDKDAEQEGNKHIILSTQTVKDGEDVDLSGINVPDRPGFYFAGWNQRTTNIRENCEIEAIYLPTQNAVAFVDWVNQTIDLRTAVTGTKLTLPVIDSDEEESPYTFRGWKKEDGTLIEGDEVTVEGNMIITADYEPSLFTVRFIGLDGSVVKSQEVEYHKSATPPAYTVPGGAGVFVGWSTDVNWWNVEEDVDVRPIVVYDEQALVPTSRIVTDENTEKRSVILETAEENADIFYTTDGTEPTAELIQEYLQTDPADYRGSIQKYTAPITLPDEEEPPAGDTEEEENDGVDIIAVSYVAGKDVSSECFEFLAKEPPEEDVDISE